MTVREHRPSIRVSERRQNVRQPPSEMPVGHPVGTTGAPAASVLSPLAQHDLRETNRQLEYRLQLHAGLLQRVKVALDRNNVKKAKEEIKLFLTQPPKPLPPLPEPDEVDQVVTDVEAHGDADPTAETVVEPVVDLEEPSEIDG
jgi:hypothetical protein